MKKKSCSDYRVHGIQIDGLNLTVSTQKLVLNNIHRVRDIGQNVSNFAGLVWKVDFGHFLCNILGLGVYFLKPIFALRP